MFRFADELSEVLVFDRRVMSVTPPGNVTWPASLGPASLGWKL